MTCDETSWVVDSGASIHATSRKDLFSSYTSGDYDNVKIRNRGMSKAIGIGDVRLETKNSTILILKNVKHIPDIRLNLISVGKLDDEEFRHTFGGDLWKLTKGVMVVARGEKCASLYVTQAREFVVALLM